MLHVFDSFKSQNQYKRILDLVEEELYKTLRDFFRSGQIEMALDKTEIEE